MRRAAALTIAVVLVTGPVLTLDRLLVLAGTGTPARDVLVLLVAIAGALVATLRCPPLPGARVVLAAAALAIAVERVGDGVVLPVTAAALALLVVWLAHPTVVPAARPCPVPARPRR